MTEIVVVMLLCLLAAAVVMVVVALPRLRGGERVLTDDGRQVVADARDKARQVASRAPQRDR